jgi:hypothetical protein
MVMEKAEFPELTNLFENMEQRFNPWGISPGERGKWAQEHEVRVLADDTKVEYLFRRLFPRLTPGAANDAGLNL